MARRTFSIQTYQGLMESPGYVEVPLYTDDKLPLVVTGGGQRNFVVTHRQSGSRVTSFERLRDAKAAVSELLPLANWTEDIDTLTRSRPHLYDEVRTVEQRIKQSRTKRSR